jgi:hypothetical protein
MVDDVPGSFSPPLEPRAGQALSPRRRSHGPIIPAPAQERSTARSRLQAGPFREPSTRRAAVPPASSLLGRFERIGALTGGAMQARSIFLQPEPDRLNRLALVVALASALTGLTLLVSTTPH